MSKASRAKRRGGRPRKLKRMVSTPALPWNGDHGTGTDAARAETVLMPIDGSNPNRFARRQRVNRIQQMTKAGFLTLRQAQAAEAIQEAYCRVQMLSSGGALREQVDSSPKPDATIAAQCDATSRLVNVMKAVRRSDRHIVEAVCWHNQPFRALSSSKRSAVRFRAAMDMVADHMMY